MLQTCLTCSGIGFKGFVSRQTLTGFIVSIHEQIVSTHGVGQIIAVVVSKAGILEGDNLPDGVIASLGLWDPHVTNLDKDFHLSFCKKIYFTSIS